MAQSKHNNPDGANQAPVPKVVAGRLSLYLRELQHLIEEDCETISSSELGSRLGLSDTQVRKDLAHFGHLGYPGVGYRVDELTPAIRKTLGTDLSWTVAIVGIGNLGRALLGYKGFGRQGFHIDAAFDADREKVGTVIEGIEVHDIADLSRVVRDRFVRLGMIAVPAPEAQSVADQLVSAGVVGIVNFAPVAINLPESVSVIGVDLAIELEQISFDIVNRRESR